MVRIPSKLTRVRFRHWAVSLLLLAVLLANLDSVLVGLNGNLFFIASVKNNRGCGSIVPLTCFCDDSIRSGLERLNDHDQLAARNLRRYTLILLAGGRCVEAIPQLEQWLATNPHNRLIRFWLGSAYLGTQEKQRGGEVWANGLGDWLWEVGKQQLERRNTVEAEWWLALAAQTERHALHDLVDLLSATGRGQEAISLLDRRVAMASHSSAEYWLASGLRSELLGDWETALAAYQHGAKLEPKEEWFHVRIKLVAEKLRHWVEALAATQMLIALQPTYWWWKYEAARLAYNAGDFDQAETYAKVALVNSPQKYIVYALLIDSACARADFKAAAERFQSSQANVEPSTGGYAPYLAYASCLWSQERRTDAIDVLHTAERTFPEAWPVVRMLSYYCDWLDNAECAIKAYKKLLTLDVPDDIKQIARSRLSAFDR